MADIIELTKADLLSMEYTELLRSSDTRVRTAATKHLGLRRVPLLDCFKPTPNKPNPEPLVIKRHQKEILDWTYVRESEVYKGICGAIIAADMGLMKTSTTFIHVLSRQRGRNPTLIVCSKTLMNSWKNDLIKFLGEEWVTENVILLHREHLGTKLKKITRESVRKVELVITAYPTCVTTHKAFLKRTNPNQPQQTPQIQEECTGVDVLYAVEWTRIVLDESQTIANPGTDTYRACCALKASKRVCLTGTPLMNEEEDVLSQLIFLGITPVPARRAWDGDRFRALGLDKVILNMDYKQAGITLPPRADFFVDVSLSPEEREAYNFVEAHARDIYNLLERGIPEVTYNCVLEVMLRLRQYCAAPYLVTLSEKHASAIEKLGTNTSNNNKLLKWLTDKEGTAGMKSSKTNSLMGVLKELPTAKVVVFSQFSGYLNLVSELLDRIGRPHFVLDGSVKTKDRESMVKKFTEENEPWVMLLNYKIGGVGLNLQAGQTAVFCDYAWNSSSMKQAVMRVWRSGQDQSVTCYYLHVTGSIEERMLEIIEEKSKLAKTYQALGIQREDDRVRNDPAREDAARLLGIR